MKPFLEAETDGPTRGALFETLGRLPGADESVIAAGLRDRTVEARVGAAKGLEILFRKTRLKPGVETVEALRRAIRENADRTLRALALSTPLLRQSSIELA